MHKFKGNGAVEDLSLRPIISNIVTAMYKLAKHLAQILKLLRQPQYTILRHININKDILLICNKDSVNTTVHHKKTNTDLYINWKIFSPNNWKWGTLKTLVSRAFDRCSTKKYLKEELNYIETAFKHQNSYPS